MHVIGIYSVSPKDPPIILSKTDFFFPWAWQGVWENSLKIFENFGLSERVYKEKPSMFTNS